MRPLPAYSDFIRLHFHRQIWAYEIGCIDHFIAFTLKASGAEP